MHTRHSRSSRTIWSLVGTLALLVTSLVPLSQPGAVRAADAADIRVVPYADGFLQPVAVTALPPRAGDLLVVERQGTVRSVSHGVVDATAWLDIRDRVRSEDNEQGLLGLALAPDFPTQPFIWVMYVALDGANTVSRFTLDSATGIPDPASEVILLALEDRATNHNGGMLAFGPDGYLYIGTGDEGGGGDPYGNAQRVDRLFGKILRLDVLDTGNDPYRIPADNLVATNPDAAPEIWAYGLRNPWRFSFDRQTGDLWIADVGQERAEEVNVIPAGSPAGTNFGWNLMEGSTCYATDECDADGIHLPDIEYGHDEGCSVTGGYRYRGSAFPEAVGTYIFGDFCMGTLWMAQQQEQDGVWERGTGVATGRLITAFGEDAAGELYLVDMRRGTIYQLMLGGEITTAGAARSAIWERTDVPVASGAAQRTWIWGPARSVEQFEPYADSPNGVRSVQYFDKARMEINDPAAPDDGLWYVTNGLLVVELMSGEMQIGNDAFEPYAPARVPVAGDLDDLNGLTYATLATLRDAPATEPGTPLDWRTDADGNLTQDAAFAERGAVAGERVSAPGVDHTVANVFWEFMTDSGLVSIDGQLVTDRLFVDPFYATGLPITEAYWTTAAVGGTPRDVLVQCFERRCLTWTPDNPDGWQVEAANVGLHYLTWRTGVLATSDAAAAP